MWRVESGRGAGSCAQRRTRISCWLLALCLILFASPALAINCSMSATTIAFGNVDVTTGSSYPGNGTLTLNCTGVPSGHPITMCVSLDGGSAYDGTSRLMNGSGAAQLRYQLYSASGLTTPWGSWPLNLYGGGYTWQPVGTSSSGTWTATVYGSVLANQQ